MNKEQQELLDEAYKNFEKWYNEHSGKKDYTGYYVPYKEEFIRLIKMDNQFSEKWGLKIEERKLSWKERSKLLSTEQFYEFGFLSPFTDVIINLYLNQKNIPTKLITITYNNETIEVYE
jgi:hypothetical protein